VSGSLGTHRTRSTNWDEKFTSVMGECVIVKL
jgi:hypothetical protein